MDRPRNPREIEVEYQQTVIRLAELMRKRSAIHALQPEIEHLHRELVLAGEAMLNDPDPSHSEQDYLEATARIQELLRQKAQAHALLPEIARLHEELADLGGMLGWHGRAAEPKPMETTVHFEDRMHRVQRQLAEIRTAIA